MTPSTEVRKGLNGKTPLIISIPIAVMIGAAVTYGAMTNEVKSLKTEVNDLKPRLRCVEQVTVTLTERLQNIMVTLQRMEHKIDKLEERP